MPCRGGDDQTIADEDPLWRRINPMGVVRDATGVRVSSAAFQDSPDGSPMSITLGRECGSHEQAIGSHHGYGLASVTAGKAREQRQVVCRDPQPEEPAHALVEGQKTGAVKKALARAAVLLVEPAQLGVGT
jgi:hypothetical protein